MDSVKREELINNLVHDAMEVARDVGDGSKSVGDGIRAHRETVAAIMSALERVPGVVDGLEQAAALIDSQIEAYIKDHGMYDSTTGHMEYPGNGEEWVADREELAEAIRALKGTAPASAVEPTETPDQLSQAGEGQPEATQGARLLRALYDEHVARVKETPSALVPGVVSDAALREILEDEFKVATASAPAVDRTILRIRQALSTSRSEEEIRADFERVLLDAITVSEFGERAATIRERIREVRRSLTNGSA